MATQAANTINPADTTTNRMNIEYDRSPLLESFSPPNRGNNTTTNQFELQEIRRNSNSDTSANTIEQDFELSQKLQYYEGRAKRMALSIFGIFLLIVGRLGIPEDDVPCVQDKLLDAFQSWNDFILAPGHELYRDGFQFLCSVLVDVTCVITFANWIKKGTSYRLPLTLTVFYVVRILVQKIYFSPFTTGYYWNSPGFPSLVVPYGRQSDFFFSGHTGFLIICALEWHEAKNYKIRNCIYLATLYTMICLLVYRIHYSIDIFAGAVFADWSFYKIDHYKDVIEEKISPFFNSIFWIAGGRYLAKYKSHKIF